MGSSRGSTETRPGVKTLRKQKHRVRSSVSLWLPVTSICAGGYLVFPPHPVPKGDEERQAGDQQAWCSQLLLSYVADTLRPGQSHRAT